VELEGVLGPRNMGRFCGYIALCGGIY